MDKQGAINIAKNILKNEIEMPENDDFVVTKVAESDDGWVIEFNSRQFLETDDLSYALVIAPILVRDDGTHRFVF